MELRTFSSNTELSSFILPLGHRAKMFLTLDEPVAGATRIPGTHSADVVALNEIRAGVDGVWFEQTANAPTTTVALSTADCLAVALVCTLDSGTLDNDDALDNSTIKNGAPESGLIWGTLFHAGWRGYTRAIHHNAWTEFKTWLNRHDVTLERGLKHLHAGISPAIFGKTYECGSDVREAIEQLERTHLQTYPQHNSKLYRELYDGRLTDGMAASNDTLARGNKIYPDLQLMMAYELVHLFGLPSENLTIVRENTFGHALLPSYRYRTLFGGNTRQRLFTHLQMG